MRITDTGFANPSSPLVQDHLRKDHPAVSNMPSSRVTESEQTQSVQSAQNVKDGKAALHVSISAEARRLQQVVNLVEQEGEMRAEKLNRIREQFAQGTYHVPAGEVAKSILRSEAARLLGEG